MTPCNRRGCPNEARWAPVLNVPIFGLTPEQHPPIQGILGLKLCDSCIKLVDVKDFNNLQEVFAHLAQGELQTDWSKAFFTPVALDSAEYELLENPPTPSPAPQTALPRGFADPRAPFPKPLPLKSLP